MSKMQDELEELIGFVDGQGCLDKYDTIELRTGVIVARMVHDHAILSVLKPAQPGGRALVSIDMELLPEELSLLQSFLAGVR